MKRRTLILSALGATGALVVGWGALPPRSRMGSPADMLATKDAVALNGWIKIAQDGSVVLAMPRSDMGQGVYTGLSMLVAEELDVPLAQVRLEQAGPDAIYGNVVMFLGSLPFHPLDSEGGAKPTSVKAGEWIVGKLGRELGIIATGGSSSVSDGWEPLRMAAATARASLVGAAAAQWKVPTSEITVQLGKLQHASGKSGHYGEFAQAGAGTSPGTVAPKERKDWKLIGTSAPRTDLVGKTNGSATFGLDVRLPEMLFAAVHESGIGT
jgi:isoquinoline 1-oxidoreductase beta subunit